MLKTGKKDEDWRYFEELVDVFYEISKDKRLLREFLLDIWTPREVEEIAKRWQIVKMLKKHIPHHKIARKLHIGVGTVSRGSREMANQSGGFHLALNKLRV